MKSLAESAVNRPEPSGTPPAVAAIGDRLLERVDDLATELTEVIRRAEPFYFAADIVPVDDLRSSVRNNLVHILGLLAGRSGLGARSEERRVGKECRSR